MEFSGERWAWFFLMLGFLERRPGGFVHDGAPSITEDGDRRLFRSLRDKTEVFQPDAPSWNLMAEVDRRV